MIFKRRWKEEVDVQEEDADDAAMNDANYLWFYCEKEDDVQEEDEAMHDLIVVIKKMQKEMLHNILFISIYYIIFLFIQQ